MRSYLNFFGSFLALILLLANALGLYYIADRFMSIDSYTNSLGGSYTVTQAAYMTTLWTALMTKIVFGIFLNIIFGIGIFLSRQVDDTRLINTISEIDMTLVEQAKQAPALRVAA